MPLTTELVCDQILIKDSHIKINGGIDKVLENLKSLKIKTIKLNVKILQMSKNLLKTNKIYPS